MKKMDMDPAKIVPLTSCKPGEISGVARDLGMEVTAARVIRRNWILILTGRCMQCESYLEDDSCSMCESDAPTKMRTEFLKKVMSINPDVVLIRRDCKTQGCGATFTYLARYVVQKEREFGNFRASSYCCSCRLVAKMNNSGPSEGRRRKRPNSRKKIEPVSDTPLVKEDPRVEEYRNTPKASEKPLAGLADIAAGMSSLAEAK